MKNCNKLSTQTNRKIGSKTKATINNTHQEEQISLHFKKHKNTWKSEVNTSSNYQNLRIKEPNDWPIGTTNVSTYTKIYNEHLKTT